MPAFVEMLAEYEEYQRQVTSQSLRLVMMSGDWVPVSLPGRIRNLFQNVEIVALGGATEGSIWSNHFEIPEIVPEDWKSIPYGKPLANQKYYVLDQNMEDCPDWVPGTLYIAGDGVAQGYLNDNEKTEEKFVVLDRTGERLYCTGDMGRYWNEGNIEFLGRLDNQVKINGYRVELGEIEAALRRIQGITEGMRFDEILRASLTMPTIMGIAQYISDCKNPSKNQMHSNAGNQTRNSYTVVYIFGDNENEIRDVLIEKLSASNISCKRVGGQEIIERCHEDISVKKKYIIAFSEMASLCITKASELLGENIIINRIFLINPSKAKESDLYLGDISIIDGNSVAIKSWEKAVLGNVREFESNSNDIFDIIMRELENDK